MSISKLVLLLTKTLIGPPASVPAGTIAWLPTTPPAGAFRVETVGWDCSSGHVVRNTSGPGATAVSRTEYTCAVDGGAHELCCTGKFRVAPPTSEGGPNAPLKPKPERVSATLHGVTG